MSSKEVKMKNTECNICNITKNCSSYPCCNNRFTVCYSCASQVVGKTCPQCKIPYNIKIISKDRHRICNWKLNLVVLFVAAIYIGGNYALITNIVNCNKKDTIKKKSYKSVYTSDNRYLYVQFNVFFKHVLLYYIRCWYIILFESDYREWNSISTIIS